MMTTTAGTALSERRSRAAQGLEQFPDSFETAGIEPRADLGHVDQLPALEHTHVQRAESSP